MDKNFAGTWLHIDEALMRYMGTNFYFEMERTQWLSTAREWTSFLGNL